MEGYRESFANDIAEACISKFNSLRKTGKPKRNTEWTLLSCFVQEEAKHTLRVVALGTGSKCIGAEQLPCDGDVLHDSHAEVIARRAFILYLLDQVRKAAAGHASIFEEKEKTYYLKSGILFHFYSSHTPCGDASIFPKQEWSECVGDAVETEAGKHCSDSSLFHPDGSLVHCSHKAAVRNPSTEPPLKRIRSEKESFEKIVMQDLKDSKHIANNCIEVSNIQEGNESTESRMKDYRGQMCRGQDLTESIVVQSDTYRTGAKCVPGEKSDPKLAGGGYHVTGVLRTKPGRGFPTLSLSCSDKMFKWSVLGVQGALLMLLLEKPVYVDTITIGQCPYNKEAMERAIYSRFREQLNDLQLPKGFHIHTPLLLQSQIDFPFSRSYVSASSPESSKIMPAPTSIIWSSTSVHKDGQEVATSGRRLGSTKKTFGTAKSWVSICRKAIFCQVLNFLKEKGWTPKDSNDFSYGGLKYSSLAYYQAWDVLKNKCLQNWTAKPIHIKEFKI